MFAIKYRFVMAALALALCACSGDDEDLDGNAGRGSAGDGDEQSGSGATGAGRGGSAGPDTGAGMGSEDAGSSGSSGGAGAGAGESGAGASGGSGDDSDAGRAGAAGSDPESECNPRAQEHEHDSLPAMHVPEPLPASSYNSSPPSSGPHCPAWGAYAVFGQDAPLPACNFLHNLEHGAIALLYNCPDGCTDIVGALEQTIVDAPDDPECGADKRLVLTPYTEMAPTVAAAAWGFTWTADCLDDGARASLLEFIAAHLGSSGDAPEPSVCGDGAITP